MLSETNLKDKEEYLKLFKSKKKRKAAIARAWLNRDFEIGLYWKRATYFWAFIATAFAAYFITQGKGFKFEEGELIVACVGWIFSLGWVLVNIGSKKWQENWEAHVDILEDSITGPIYKTVYDKNGFSVSGVNLMISWFVVVVWFLLIAHYIISCSGSFSWIDRTILIITLVFTILLIGQIKKSPRGYFANSKKSGRSFSIRPVTYYKVDQNEDKST